MPYETCLVPQEECLAATSSSLHEIQQLHDSLPVTHALFPPTSGAPENVSDPSPVDVPPPGPSPPPEPDNYTIPRYRANPPAMVNSSRSPASAPTVQARIGFAAALITLLLAI